MHGGTRQTYTIVEIEFVRAIGVRLFRVSMAMVECAHLSGEQRVAARRWLGEAEALLGAAAKMEKGKGQGRGRLGARRSAPGLGYQSVH